MKIKNLTQLKQALNDQLKSNLNKANNTTVTIKESKYICMHLFHSISKCINANNSKKPLLESYVQLCISIKHNDVLKEIMVDVNKNNKNAIISVNDYDDNQFNDLDEFDLMLTIMQTIKQYCTK